jgi:hypothetical protein
MKRRKQTTKHSLVERGRIAARLLVEGMAIEDVTTRCNLNQELALQVLIKALADCQGQLAERLAVVQRLHQTLEDQMRKGVIYPAPMALASLHRRSRKWRMQLLRFLHLQSRSWRRRLSRRLGSRKWCQPRSGCLGSRSSKVTYKARKMEVHENSSAGQSHN